MLSPSKSKGYLTIPSEGSPASYSTPLVGGPYHVQASSESTTNMLPVLREDGTHNPEAHVSPPSTPVNSHLFNPPLRVSYGAFARNPSYRSSLISMTGYSDASTIGLPTGSLSSQDLRKYYAPWGDKDIQKVDDELHDDDPVKSDAETRPGFSCWNMRGWINVLGALIVLVGVLTLFAGYPLLSHFLARKPPVQGFNLGGINGSGQIPDLPGLPRPIDPDTPQSALAKTGVNGDTYSLVFSDEFNVDGRTFFPGDDPYWEAVDLYYWPTADLEWYSPEAITTKDGKLQITISEMLNHNVNFQSGMLQSWNKLCFTTGILEASISLPGDGVTPGFWPGFWSMGNLGRPGYGSTTDGTWPYTYDNCDTGTLPNQTNPDGTPPAAATSGTDDKTDHKLSFLPGQKLSACSCSNTRIPEDHPGPFPTTGRGAPEIDVIEAQIDTVNREGQASQSFQVAPFNAGYLFNNQTPAVIVNNPAITKFNDFKGSVTQQAVSGVSQIGTTAYGGLGYQTYGYEWFSNPSHRDKGFISWYVGDTTMWTMNPAAVGPEIETEISQRLIPEEPMAIVLNLGMSPGFQHADFKNLKFPATMFIDYIRIYQRDGVEDGLTCNPKAYPTSDYIEAHLNAYSNANLTTWKQAGYDFPGNSLLGQC